MEMTQPVGEAIAFPRWSDGPAPQRILEIRPDRVRASDRAEGNRGVMPPWNHRSIRIRANHRSRSADERRCAWLKVFSILDTRPGADRLRLADKTRLHRSDASGRTPVSSQA